MHGLQRIRTKPYTARGIKRVNCAHCGATAACQWRICSYEGYIPLCKHCDARLNKYILIFALGHTPTALTNGGLS